MNEGATSDPRAARPRSDGPGDEAPSEVWTPVRGASNRIGLWMGPFQRSPQGFDEHIEGCRTVPIDGESDMSGHEGPWDRGRVVMVAVLFEGSLAPLALFLGWCLGQDPLEKVAWDVRGAVWGVLATVPMVAMFLVGLRWPVGPLLKIKRFFDEEVVPLLGGRPVSDLALIALAAGVGEEMLFRGVVQGALVRWLGTWEGLIIASGVFGLLHPITRAYAVIAAVLGAYLGAIWIASGNLLSSMIAHALYDFCALCVLLRGPGSDRELQD